ARTGIAPYDDGDLMHNPIDYAKLSAEALQHMRELVSTMPGSAVRSCSCSSQVSQINGCNYCIGRHTRAARTAGETEARLSALPQWQSSALFNAREKAALGWAELLTPVRDAQDVLAQLAALKAHFTDKQISDLTFAVATINAWNIIGISFIPTAAEKRQLQTSENR
ncbi:MAG: carboxymuconolactone decarboxylase family protein, partial [Betaproteobacteria bacterium]